LCKLRPNIVISRLFAYREPSMIRRSLQQFIALILTLCTSVVLTHASDMNPEEILSHHLDSIAPAATRAAARTRVVQGVLKFRVMVGGAGEVTGSWGRVSSDRMSNFVMRFGGGDWRGEQFAYDGSKTGFAAATASHQRSAFGQFISSQDFIVKEGLLGGKLSTAWPCKISKQITPGWKLLDARELTARTCSGPVLFEEHRRPAGEDLLQPGDLPSRSYRVLH
jgi:hypothetical protein